MVSKVPGLLRMEYGPYNGDEGLNEDFTHGFLMTFDSPESRDAYLPHPLHEKVKEVVVIACVDKCRDLLKLDRPYSQRESSGSADRERRTHESALWLAAACLFQYYRKLADLRNSFQGNADK